jgi:hypothetical protein
MDKMKYDIALLTEKKYVNPAETDWYMDQVLEEDGLVKTALENLGYSVIIVDWADPNFDWSSVKIAIFRTIWDYFHRFDEFQIWMDSVKNKTTFVNSFEQILWNIDKHYLADLEADGIPIVPSYFIETGTNTTLTELNKKLGWNKSVIKPCVSGGGRHTYLLNSENWNDHEAIFQELIAKEPMMLQPFMESITTKGEVSHIVIAGKHTHSILKLAKAGDYRVQDDFGGSVHDYTPTNEEIAFAESVALACDPTPSYARVDLVWDNNDQLAVGEVELIEPEMWFRKHPEAATALAKEIDKQFKALA